MGMKKRGVTIYHSYRDTNQPNFLQDWKKIVKPQLENNSEVRQSGWFAFDTELLFQDTVFIAAHLLCCRKQKRI